MSFHGVFLRLPFAMSAKTNNELPFDVALAANFYSILQRVGKNEKLISFSEIMWPFQAIQAEPNYHILIDDVGVFSFNEKLTNSPRIAQAGHVLRDASLDYLTRLELTKKVLSFQHKIQLDSNNEENGLSDEEFIQKEIKGIVNSNFIQGLNRIINYVKEFPIADFSTLESVYSFDNALNSAQMFIQSLEFSQGNKHRWDTTKKLVEDPTEKWKLDLNVKLKDTEERYKSLLLKAQELNDSKIVTTLDLAKDSADQWLLREQKNIIERIGKMFIGVDLICDNIKSKNRFFLNTEQLKTYEINEVIAHANDHLDFIKQAMLETEEKIAQIAARMTQIGEDVTNTSLSAEERVKRLNSELMDKKMEQENRIKQLENERDNEIGLLKSLIDNLDHLLREIHEYIDKKAQDCLFDVQTLRKWQMDDKIAKIPASTGRYFLPVGVGIIQDEDEEERIEVVLPCIYKENLEREQLSDGFWRLEKSLSKILDKNMKIRSNFEFTIEKRNIKNYEPFRKAIKLGADILVNEKIANLHQKGIIIAELETLH
jgi:hypothetical protein